MKIRSFGFLALGFALLPVACGSDGTASEVSPLVCDPGVFQLQGTLGGESIDVRETSDGGGFIQFNTGELLVADFDIPGMPRTKVDLTWPRGILNGESSWASGTLTLIAGSFAGQPLCVGKGTTVTMYRDDKGVGLVLDGAASGAKCDHPIEGTLAGCWRPRDQMNGGGDQGSSVSPMRNLSTPLAAARPSWMAHTISDCPRAMSPAAKMPGTLVPLLSSTATLPRGSMATPSSVKSPGFSGPDETHGQQHEVGRPDLLGAGLLFHGEAAVAVLHPLDLDGVKLFDVAGPRRRPAVW